MESSERKWVELAKQGNKLAMTKLYDMYYKSMFNTAYRITNDFHFAQDVMQEAFLKAFENIRSFEGRSHFGAWLKRIVINESLQWIRKYGKWNTGEEDAFLEKTLHNSLNTADESGVDEIFSQGNPADVLGVLRKLKDNYRTILSLYYLEGYDYDEITEIMGISYQNARTMLSRAKAALKKQFQKTV